MRRLTYLGLATVCAASMHVRAAYACGGFFCSSSPIDQAGETIVYGLEDDGTLTMAVQIRYSGDDDDFAWIVPVPAPPEISLGTDVLFDALRGATEPVFVTRERVDGYCRPHPRCEYADGSAAGGGGGCGPSGGGGGWTGGYVDASSPPTLDPVADAGAHDSGGGVTVFSQGSIGPYDTVVLGAATADEVVTWLREHDYDVPDASLPLLQAYEGSRQIFVALRLASNPETRQIRPIVLRMATDEACLPIRLTAVATVPDLPITAFFLGDARVVPFNYSSVDVDVGRLGFWRGELTWEAEVTRAVDAMGGQAFVTDYAGPTPAVSIELPAVTDLAEEADPARFLRAVSARGYPGDALLRELYERYLVPPEGSEARAYYNCLARDPTSECGAPARFDPSGLSAAIEAQITTPRREAHALVYRHGRLTRLFTTMSAAEMTIDPIFVVDEGSPDVSNVHRATQVTECSDTYYEEDAPSHWELGDTILPIRAGTPADDAAYCRSLGAYLEGTAPRTSSRSSGCLCGVAGVGSVQWGALAVVAAVALARRRRRHG